MQRRQVLAAAATTLAAGCMGGRLNYSDQPRISWDASSDGYVGEGFQPTAIVHGDVTNTSDTYIETVTVECELVDGNDQSIDQARRTLEAFDAGETQLFYFEFMLGANAMRRWDGVDLEFWIDGERVRY